MGHVLQKDREAIHALVVPSTKVFIDEFALRHGVSITGVVEALLNELADAVKDNPPHVDAVVERTRRIDYERRQRERTKPRA